MNMLLLHGSSDLYGASKIFLQTAVMLSRKGHACHVILSAEGPLSQKLQQEGIPVSIVNLAVIRKKYYSVSGLVNRFMKFRSAAKAIKQLVREKNISLIYSNTTAVWVGAWVAKRTGVKHLWHVHEIIEKPWLLKRFIGYLLNGWANRSVVVSDAVLEHWKPMVRATKLVRVYNGISLEPALDGDRERFRIKHNIPLDAQVLGMAGRVHYWKGQMEFLEIAKHMHKMRPEMHFVIAGDPYPGYEYLVDKMQQYMRENDMHPYVHYIGFCDEMPAFYAAIDVFMLPSTGPDPFPTVILEAMHAAKPVICTITGGAKEMVEKNITGTYITTLFLEQAATLSLGAFDERIGPDYGKCGKERVEEYFTREAYEKNMLDVIETI